jgi:hypothetical protein
MDKMAEIDVHLDRIQAEIARLEEEFHEPSEPKTEEDSPDASNGAEILRALGELKRDVGLLREEIWQANENRAMLMKHMRKLKDAVGLLLSKDQKKVVVE